MTTLTEKEKEELVLNEYKKNQEELELKFNLKERVAEYEALTTAENTLKENYKRNAERSTSLLAWVKESNKKHPGEFEVTEETKTMRVMAK